MPWEKKYSDTDMLERAMHAFWARGYEATSMRDLVEATGVNRGSLYSAYTDKRTLFIAALKHYDRIHRDGFLTRIADVNEPRQAILAAFETAAAGSVDAPGGCLLVNTALELSPHDEEIGTLVDGCLRQVERFFRTSIEAAKRQGTVGADLDAKKTAQALLGLFLGLRVITRANPRPSVVSAITTQAEAMLR